MTSKKRAMMAAVCFQSRVSVCSCLRPAHGKAIEAGAAIVFRGTPLRGNRAFILQLQQQGIKGALVDSQNISADLFNASSDAVAVLRAQNIEGFEDHQCKRSLQYVRLFFHRKTHL